MHKLNITEKVIKELKSKYKKADEEKVLQIQVLKSEIEKLNRLVETERSQISQAQRERDMVAEKLSQEVAYRLNFEKEYQNQMIRFTNFISERESRLSDEQKSMHKEMGDKIQAFVKQYDEKCEGTFFKYNVTCRYNVCYNYLLVL